MHYVFTDIHGDMKSWNAVKEQFGQPENMLIFLGDACDRGADGYEIMKDIYNMDNTCYLKGNHEDMFVKAAKEILKWKNENCLSTEEIQRMDIYEICPYNDDVSLHLYNGGIATINAWIKDGMPRNIISLLAQLPVRCQVDNYDMCHAGVQWELWQENLNKESQEFKEECLWNRKHFNYDWEKDRILIHGHTPTVSGHFRFLADMNYKRKHVPIQYANNTKINLDTRSIEVDFLWVYCLETKEFIKVEKKNEA